MSLIPSAALGLTFLPVILGKTQEPECICSTASLNQAVALSAGSLAIMMFKHNAPVPAYLSTIVMSYAVLREPGINPHIQIAATAILAMSTAGVTKDAFITGLVTLSAVAIALHL